MILQPALVVTSTIVRPAIYRCLCGMVPLETAIFIVDQCLTLGFEVSPRTLHGSVKSQSH
jgi:hypothetical protein